MRQPRTDAGARRGRSGTGRTPAVRPEQARPRTFIPDCIVLSRRVLADDRTPRSRRALILALIAYLAMPFDLVPDFIPVAGQLDDAILVAIVLRSVLRTGGPDLLSERWPGPKASRDLISRLAFGRAATSRYGLSRARPSCFATKSRAPRARSRPSASGRPSVGGAPALDCDERGPPR